MLLRELRNEKTGQYPVWFARPDTSAVSDEVLDNSPTSMTIAFL